MPNCSGTRQNLDPVGVRLDSVFHFPHRADTRTHQHQLSTQRRPPAAPPPYGSECCTAYPSRDWGRRVVLPAFSLVLNTFSTQEQQVDVLAMALANKRERRQGQQRPHSSTGTSRFAPTAPAADAVCRCLLLCVPQLLFGICVPAAVKAQKPTPTQNASADNTNKQPDSRASTSRSAP